MARTEAMLAEFSSAGALLTAAEKVRGAGYRQFDCHSPFPIHGMDQAMGLKRSPVGFIVGIMATIGAAIGLGLQGWASAIEYPLVIAGKPLFSWQAYIIITFALGVLFGTFGAVFGMFYLNRLPRWYHPLFSSKAFEKVTTDGFFLSVDAGDPKFDSKGTTTLLQELGSIHVETVASEEADA